MALVRLGVERHIHHFKDFFKQALICRYQFSHGYKISSSLLQHSQLLGAGSLLLARSVLPLCSALRCPCLTDSLQAASQDGAQHSALCDHCHGEVSGGATWPPPTASPRPPPAWRVCQNLSPVSTRGEAQHPLVSMPPRAGPAEPCGWHRVDPPSVHLRTPKGGGRASSQSSSSTQVRTLKPGLHVCLDSCDSLLCRALLPQTPSLRDRQTPSLEGQTDALSAGQTPSLRDRHPLCGTEPDICGAQRPGVRWWVDGLKLMPRPVAFTVLLILFTA